MVLDQRGYLRVTDLGIARILRPDNNSDTSGTPGYMGTFLLISIIGDFGTSVGVVYSKTCV